MNQMKLAETIFESKAYPPTRLEKSVLAKLPNNWLVFSLKQEGEKFKVDILLKQKLP